MTLDLLDILSANIFLLIKLISIIIRFKKSYCFNRRNDKIHV